MGSLTGCIAKAGKYLDPADKKAILESAKANRAAGLSASEAGIKAVQELLETVRALLPPEAQAEPDVEAPGPVAEADLKFARDIPPKIGRLVEDAADSEGAIGAEPDVGFEIKQSKDGSITVLGDPEEIRAMLPVEMIGRATADGVVFQGSIAPQVRATLAGDAMKYSRAGVITVHARYVSGTRAGQYIGAPAKFNTPAKIPTLRALFRSLALEGVRGRFWYEESGRAVLDYVGHNQAEARKFLALLAIYSPQAKVNANTTMALSAWAQYKVGQKIDTKTEVMDAKAEAVLLDPDSFWKGEKTSNFFLNLLRSVDSSTEGKQGATVDMWMMRAAQYLSDAPTTSQYKFVEVETNILAAEMGWEPQQVQAAIWTAIKARTENKDVKKNTEATSVKRKWMHYETGPKGKPVRVVDNEAKHRQLWLNNALAHDVTTDDITAAAYHFGTALGERSANISWEATPGKTTGDLTGIHSAPVPQQEAYRDDVIESLKDERGRDMIDAAIGILVDSGLRGHSGWQGEASVGVQQRAAVYREGTGRVESVSRALIELNMIIRGIVLRQEGMAWHIPIYGGAKYGQNGVEFNIGRQLNAEETASLYAAITVELQDSESPPIPTATGFRVLSFPGEKFALMEDGLTGEKKRELQKSQRAKNAAFVKAVQAAVEQQAWAGSVTGLTAFETDGDLIGNDWSNGHEDYRRAAEEKLGTLGPTFQGGWSGRSDLFEWIERDLRPRVEAVNARYQAKYGWGKPAAPEVAKGSDTSFSRDDTDTPAFKAWFGDSKVVTSDGKPMPVYTGTSSDADFNAFRAPKNGIWFSSNPTIASEYARDNDSMGLKYNGKTYDKVNDAPRVLPVYLSLQNPKVYEQWPDEIRLSNNYKKAQGVLFGQLMRDGYDGAIMDDIYVVFKSEQVKSSIGNRGTFDATKKNISFARSPYKVESVQEMLDAVRTASLPQDLPDAIAHRDWSEAYRLAKDPAQRKKLLREIGDFVIERFPDAKIRLSRWIQGLPLTPLMRQRLEGNLRRADTVRSHLEKEVKDKFTAPMFDAISAAAKASGLSTDQTKKFAGWWMSAVYAKEANQHLIRKDRAALIDAQATNDPAKIAQAQHDLADRLADVNGAVGQVKTRGVGGGMNDAEADQAVADIEAKIPLQMLKDIAAPVYAMMDWKKAQDLRVGKVTQAIVNGWVNSPRYVPLTGDPRHDSESTDVFSAGGQVNQENEHVMEGRKDSVADDGIDAAFTATIKSVNFAAMQDFKVSLNRAYMDATAAGQDIGLVRENITGVMRPGDNVVMFRAAATRANGMQHMVAHAFKFKDQRIMEALKKGNVESTNAVLSIIRTPTRWYGRLVTQFMPAFAPLNFVRDIWERTEFLRTRDLFDSSGQKIDVKKAARASLWHARNPEVWKATVGKSLKTGWTGVARGNLEEMIRVGGSSTWGDYLSRTASTLHSELREHGNPLKRPADKLVGGVEAWNNAFELVPALAVYMSLKEQNMTPKDAAAATLDLMNFRKQGTAMPAVKALYIFANPAAQSGHNLAKYLSTPVGRRRFAAQAVLGAVLYAFLKGLWGDDEDEEIGNKLDNLSNWTVERSIPIPLGDTLVKVPVGFGPPQLAWMTAGVVNRWLSGRYDTVDAIGEFGKGWIKSVAPIAPSEMEISKRPADFFFASAIPTVIKPLFAIVADMSNMGAPVTPTFKDPNKLKSEQARRLTAPIYTEIAKEIHEQTGIDIYPDHIKTLVDGYLVGPFREIINMAIESPAKAARGEPIKLPLVAQIVDNINDRQILNAVYYRHRNDMETAHREFGSMDGDKNRRGDITPDQRNQEREYQRFATIDKRISTERNSARKIEDEDVRNARLQEIEEKADAARRAVLVVYLGGKSN